MSEIKNLPPRFVTATSLFDGHDASINIIRRILQTQGAEVIHLGHNRSVKEILKAALEENADAIAVSSYQGGHIEFFKYIIDQLKKHDSSHIKVFGGGGGVITPPEISELEKYGVEKIYSPEEGQKLGLEGIISDMIQRTQIGSQTLKTETSENHQINLARKISLLERGELKSIQTSSKKIPVIGLTGTGGAGKSNLSDELLRHFLEEFPELRIAVLAMDPTKRKTGGGLLGDRIRVNSASNERVFFRSMGIREHNQSTNSLAKQAIELFKENEFDLIFLETSGIGQSDSSITSISEVSIYVMTPDFGAPTQLEKIDMLDFADFIVLNKFGKRGAEDALKAVVKQYQRNHNLFETKPEELPIFGTIANRFNDAGTTSFYKKLVQFLEEKYSLTWKRREVVFPPLKQRAHIPHEKENYLREIAACIAQYKKTARSESSKLSLLHSLFQSLKHFTQKELKPLEKVSEDFEDELHQKLALEYNQILSSLHPNSIRSVQHFFELKKAYREEAFKYHVRKKEIQVNNFVETLSGTQLPKIGVPDFKDWGQIFEWMSKENFPGAFPFTAGVFPFKREGEDPVRMFAGEGNPERTNKRFLYLSKGQSFARLSTAFDSVTLYGADPAIEPDIYGKVGNAGVSICNVDDIKKLYSGIDLMLPSTSVSMTINGPAPVILAFFFNAAIDQQVERHLAEKKELQAATAKIKKLYQEKGLEIPVYNADYPENHNQFGLQLLGISGDQFVDQETYEKIKNEVIGNIRGTVQADILKEDQAQNTCIFSTLFALKMMGDIQEYLSAKDSKSFYSVSISGYHIAEAGANPITQVAFTLANGFTLIEYYLSRGMEIDLFARNLSYFFSNGMDAEYAVIGRVARRIFAIALRDNYGANERSQKLKYHIQTSGRSLHAQEIDFNDIRTTLQALYAIYDNCNSLHTNAYDEAITTPTEESVRRALAIQMIINKELGLVKGENFLQGSFVLEELTDLVEEAILAEFNRISDRGGVLGAMETLYQRTKIQEESMLYEHKKFSGELPIIGVNTFLKEKEENPDFNMELARSTEDEKKHQIEAVQRFQEFHRAESQESLQQLKEVAVRGENIFEQLLETVKHCTLGQITQALYEVGGQYRRHI